MVTTVEVEEKLLEEQVVAEPAPDAIQQATSETLAETCVHYWLIERAQKPTSEGRCKKCNEVRTFKNSIENKPPAGRPRKASGGIAG